MSRKINRVSSLSQDCSWFDNAAFLEIKELTAFCFLPHARSPSTRSTLRLSTGLLRVTTLRLGSKAQARWEFAEFFLCLTDVGCLRRALLRPFGYSPIVLWYKRSTALNAETALDLTIENCNVFPREGEGHFLRKIPQFFIYFLICLWQSVGCTIFFRIFWAGETKKKLSERQGSQYLCIRWQFNYFFYLSLESVVVSRRPIIRGVNGSEFIDNNSIEHTRFFVKFLLNRN